VLDHGFDSSRWVALHSLAPFLFAVPVSVFDGCCGVVGGKVKIQSFDVRNTIAGSHTEHAWSRSETRKKN
jgi:hypothetical protein